MTNEEIMNLSLEDIEARKAEIKALVEDEASEADFDALSAEVDSLEERKAVLIEEQRKADILAVAEGAGEETTIEIPMEEKSMKSLKEIRDSQAYIEAFAKYIKTDDDKECRALLTELADGDYGANVVPVPTFVEDEIRTAWANSKILSGVKKTYIKGILKVGFELSATGAVVHAEGTDAPLEEELIIGVVTLTPASIKKWITVSDEAIDLKGEAFLRYIYDELTYQITKKIEDEIVGMIVNAEDTSSTTAIGVPTIAAEAGLATVASALAELGDRAANPVVIINRKTLGTFKAVQYSGNYAIDPFEGCTVLFNDTLDEYDEDSDNVYMLVGDLAGIQANFPEGDGVTIKYDDLSLAEKDLVKIVGREYVALGITMPQSFVKVIANAGS